jgi:hypothetical protein
MTKRRVTKSKQGLDAITFKFGRFRSLVDDFSDGSVIFSSPRESYIIDRKGPYGPPISVIASSPDPVSRIELLITVEYKKYGRSDVFSRSNAANNTNKVTVNLRTEFMGGDLTKKARALVKGKWYEGSESGVITAENPTKKQMKDQSGNLAVSVISYVLSKFSQFDSGYPKVISSPRGYRFGTSGLINPDLNQIWNWRKNIDAGRVEYEGVLCQALKYPEDMRQNGYPHLKNFNEQQSALETFERIGSFQNYWIPGRSRWMKNTRVSGFADKCLKVYKAVKKGKPPQDWD